MADSTSLNTITANGVTYKASDYAAAQAAKRSGTTRWTRTHSCGS